MVAYSFKRDFVEPIRAGTKTQAIRGDRARHARPGESIQLYSGLRTRQCERIMADPVCTEALWCELWFGDLEEWQGVTLVLCLGESHIQRALGPDELSGFARADGFADWQALKDWFQHTHLDCSGPNGRFHGTLINWGPRWIDPERVRKLPVSQIHFRETRQ